MSPAITPSVALVVFTKTPGYLAPKTRLAKDIGSIPARRVHKAFFEHTAELVRGLEHEMDVFWSCAEREATGDAIWSDKNLLWDPAESLKMKVCSVTNRLLNHYDQVVVIGTDCPYLTPSHIQSASRRLHTKSQVLGPTEDGGFYLFGSRESLPEGPWESTQWGQSQTAAQVMGLFPRHQMALLEPLCDVDTVEDFQKFILGTGGFQELSTLAR